MFDVDVAVVTNLDVVGPLQTLALENNWRTFPVHEGVGGRFSVFSEPGLITGAIIGLDIKAFLEGAKDMENQCLSKEVANNPALLNAALKYVISNHVSIKSSDIHQRDWPIDIFKPYQYLS